MLSRPWQNPPERQRWCETRIYGCAQRTHTVVRTASEPKFLAPFFAQKKKLCVSCPIYSFLQHFQRTRKEKRTAHDGSGGVTTRAYFLNLGRRKETFFASRKKGFNASSKVSKPSKKVPLNNWPGLKEREPGVVNS